MKTDSLFYELFRRWPGVALDLAGLDPALADQYQFRAEEIKQTALRLDGLLTPRTTATTPPFLSKSNSSPMTPSIDACSPKLPSICIAPPNPETGAPW